MDNLIAVQEIDAAVCGAITYWRLSGNTDYNTLRTAWLAAGLPKDWLIMLPSPADALRRAMAGQKERRRLVRPLADDHGWAVIREELGSDKQQLRHEQEFSVNLTEWGTLEFSGVINGEAKEIEAAYITALDTLTSADVGGWLVELAKRITAVSLRDSGGIYFVPRNQMPTWNTIAEVLHQTTSNIIHKVPAMNGKDAAAAVLDGLQHEAERLAKDISDDLRKGVGKRAINTKRGQCEELKTKLDGYAAMLGDALDGLKDKAFKLGAQLQKAENTKDKSEIDKAISELFF